MANVKWGEQSVRFPARLDGLLGQWGKRETLQGDEFAVVLPETGERSGE